MTATIPVYDGSEVGLLQAGFNEMTAGLRDRERIREAFGTYLDREVAEHVLRSGTSLAGEEVEVTAMLIDVRDFTGFAERAGAREVVATINRLFERAVPIIHDHGGHVDKFVGDGPLAVFGAPRRQADHGDQALAAAIQIARAVEAENSAALPEERSATPLKGKSDSVSLFAPRPIAPPSTAQGAARSTEPSPADAAARSAGQTPRWHD